MICAVCKRNRLNCLTCRRNHNNRIRRENKATWSRRRG